MTENASTGAVEHKRIPIAPSNGLLQESCNGCKHNLYSARHGQASNKEPHSRCKALNVDVPLVLGEGDKWRGSLVPNECPTFRQQDLFGA